jgi:hypothetical protein
MPDFATGNVVGLDITANHRVATRRRLDRRRFVGRPSREASPSVSSLASQVERCIGLEVHLSELLDGHVALRGGVRRRLGLEGAVLEHGAGGLPGLEKALASIVLLSGCALGRTGVAIPVILDVAEAGIVHLAHECLSMKD